MTMPQELPAAQQDDQLAAKAGDSGTGKSDAAGKTAAGTQQGNASGTANGTASGTGKSDAAGKTATGTQQNAATGTQQGSAAGNGKTDAAGKTTTGTQQGNAAGANGTTNGTTSGTANGSGNAASKAATGTQQNGQQGSSGTNTGAAGGKTATGTQASASGTKAGGTAAASGDKAAASKELDFGVIYPSYTPQGVKQLDEAQITLGDEKANLIRYSGTYNYSIVELKPEAKETYLVPGDIVDLGYTIAVLSGDQKKTLIWTYDGVEYRLSTADLPQDEMIKVAQTVQGQLGK
jgi:hypothetical protein